MRPVYFPRINGPMEWTAPDGLDYAATFDDPLTRDLANQRLRTALDVEGEWLPAVLAQAHAQLIAPAHARSRAPPAWSSPSIRNTPGASPRSWTSGWG